MARNKRPITQTEFRERYERDGHGSISKGQVSKDVSAGMPLTSFEDALAWRAANKDASKPKAKGNARNPAPAEPVQAASVAPRNVSVEFPDGTVLPLDQIPAFAVSQAAKMHWDAEMKKRDVLAHDREHIPKADVLAVVGEIMGLFRAGVMGIAGRLANPLEGKTAAERHHLIQGECRAVLDDVAKRIDDAAARAFEDADDGLDDDGSDDDEADE